MFIGSSGATQSPTAPDRRATYGLTQKNETWESSESDLSPAMCKGFFQRRRMAHGRSWTHTARKEANPFDSWGIGPEGSP